MVCATARSGSNLLTDGLHATRRAGRPKQFFLPKFREEYGRKHDLSPSADFSAYVAGIIPATSTSNEVFGFKVMGWYLADFLAELTSAFAPAPSEIDLLRRIFPRLRFLRIIRRNKLRQAISKAKALQSGLWKIQPGNEAVNEPVFDRELIDRCLAETRADERVWEDFFTRNSITPHTVEYEALCDDYEATVHSTLAYLGVKISPSQRIEPATIRQADATSLEWERLYERSATVPA